ncbi:MAG: hypothetical protein CME63_13080 [Halobacteriovoraceae bacterium]|nr:hypothetical protein [Halobacteriovoraceae bacterium]|tara:strand:+ start:252268 stop:254139 length:1872 start_codon:yes stop_codon:yes gene_type:complete
MKLNKTAPVLLLSLILVGCATGHREGQQNSPEEKISSASSNGEKELSDEEVAKAFDNLDKRMEEMVASAKKEGPEAVKFVTDDLFFKANDASMRGDSHTAAYIFKHLVALQPKDFYIRKKYAVELIRIGSLEESKEILEPLLVESDYKDETLGLILGGVQTALEEKEEARETYSKVMVKHPGNEEACIFLAKSYGMEAKYKKSHHLLDKCFKKNKRASFLYYNGKVFLKEGKISLAQKKFKHALKVDPTYYQAAMAMGLTKEDKGDTKGAIKVYKNFLEASPQSFPVLSRLVQLMFSKEMFAEVLPYAERLSSLDASDLNLKVRLGILYTDAKSFDKAIGVFKEILAAVPSSDKVLYYLGTLYQEVEKPEMAMDYFGQIPETSNLYADSSLQMAKIMQILVELDHNKWSKNYVSHLEERGQKVEALKVEFQVMMATYYESQYQYGDAIASLEKVREVNDYTENHDYYLASLYEKNKDYISSRKIIKAILNDDPNNADALNFLGYSLLESGDDIDEAYRLITKAVSLKPEDGYIRDSLGWFYYKTGKIEKALVEIQKAFDLVKTDVVITKHLAIIYRDLEKFDMAKKYFVEALRNCKLESERKDILDSLGPLKDLRLPASSVVD